MVFEHVIFKLLYWYISTVDKNKEVIFMNYGYHDENDTVHLHESDEKNRFSIQLYHRLAKTINLKDKHILEVGCGRGGGISYISRYFSPQRALGIDLNAKAAKFGNKNYNVKGLSFMQGDAQNLNLPDESFDAVFNVESSHRYPKIEDFFNEVYRVLKPGGYFLYTDFRSKDEMDDLLAVLSKYEFDKFDEQIINEHVKKALDQDTARRENIIKRLAPVFLRKPIRDFAGNQGSATYNSIANGDIVYFVFCFQKK